MQLPAAIPTSHSIAARTQNQSSLPISCIAHVSLQKAAALTPQLVAAFIATSDASETDSLKPDLRNAERPFLFCRISDFSVVAKQYQWCSAAPVPGSKFHRTTAGPRSDLSGPFPITVSPLTLHLLLQRSSAHVPISAEGNHGCNLQSPGRCCET